MKFVFKLGVVSFLIVAMVCLFGIKYSVAADSSYFCSVRQGFNFEKDSQILVGYLVYLKIGDRELNRDLNVTDPENIKKTIKVVGVMSGIYWKGGYADPIRFSSQVSTDNKNTLAPLIHKLRSNTEVEFVFVVYDYDNKAKKYYRCFHTDTDVYKKELDNVLEGLIQKSGGEGELAMNIAMDKSEEIVSPKNYTFNLGVMPQDINMEIHLAVSVSDKFVKKWGVEVAK